jgi:hypothetical protein
MRPRDRTIAKELGDRLNKFNKEFRELPGIQNPTVRTVFIDQLLESIHRVRFVSTIRQWRISDRRKDPNDEMFHPLKAAILHQTKGEIEEAFWLVFLFVHFGRSRTNGWKYARALYGRLGKGPLWTWAAVSTDCSLFSKWFDGHLGKFQGLTSSFGNHRKYEKLANTGRTVSSYVAWVNPPTTHQQVVSHAVEESSGDPRKTFDLLYRSMNGVYRFGRTAKFDYLAMLGKMGLAPIEPGLTYMTGSTGPLAGAQQLFGSKETPQVLERHLVELNSVLEVGMQAIEDSLCNWQKSPAAFKAFRG